MKTLGIIAMLLGLLMGGATIITSGVFASGGYFYFDRSMRWLPSLALLSLSSVGLFVGGCILLTGSSGKEVENQNPKSEI